MIDVAIEGAVATIAIDRPERRNALSGELCVELADAFRALDGVRSVVLTGAGSAFCAGADLVTRFGSGDGDGGVTDSFRPSFEILLDTICDCAVPVIAAINGPAIGAGMQLAVACDLRVCTPSANMSIPGGKLGILLSPKNIWRLSALVGHGLARDFLLTGRQVTGSEALALGLVQRVADDALAAAQTLALHVSTLAPLTVQGHKHALNLVSETTMLGADAFAALRGLEAAAFASDDLREGTAAFAEKRDPTFHGR